MITKTNPAPAPRAPRVKTHLTRLIIAAMLLQLAAPQNLPAAPVTFAPEPLANSTGAVHPNLLFMLDESASMAEDFLPEYVRQDTLMQYSSVPVFNGQFANCFDSGDANFGPGIQGNPIGCGIGDPPHMSSDFNRIYYDPSITYTPGVQTDGSTPFPSQTNPAAVATDPYGVQRTDQLGNNVSSINIVTGYPDRVWCTANSDAANGPNCLKNNLYKDGVRNDYTYPDAVYSFGLDAALANTKYVFGNPYYYKIIPTQYCADTNLTNCIATAPGVPPSGTNAAYSIPAPVRWCKYRGTTDTAIDYNNLSFTENGVLVPAPNNCQAKQNGVYQYPRFLGKVDPATAGHAAFAAITIPSNPAGYQDITSITAGPLPINALTNPNILNGTLSGYTTAGAAASAIAASINSKTTAYPIGGSPGSPYEFIACAGSGTSGTGCNQLPFSDQVPAPGSVPANTAYVIPATPGGAWPGAPLPYIQGTGTYPTFPDLVLAGSPPSPGTVTIPAIGVYPVHVTAVNVNGANVCTGCQLDLAAGTSASAAATAIAAVIGSGFTASASGAVITITSTTNVAVQSLSISANSTPYGTLAAPTPNSGNTPLIISAVIANGTNALTSTRNFAPLTSANSVAASIAAVIGNGYSATNVNPQTSVAGGIDFITSNTNATISTLVTTAVNSYGSVLAVASGTTLPDYISAINVTAGATTNALTGPLPLALPASNTASQNATLIASRIGGAYIALPANIDPITGNPAPGSVFIISSTNQKITAVTATATHSNYGTLTPPAVVAGNDITLSAITANGVNLLLPSGNLLLTAPKTNVQATSAIAAAINLNSGTSGFSATIVGNDIWINSSSNAAIATLTTTSVNYGTIVVPNPNTGTRPDSSTTPLIVSAITVNGANRLASTVNFVPNNSAVNDATQIVAGIGGGFTASNVGGTSATITIKSGTNLVIDNTLAATANDSYGTVTALATASFPAFISAINVTAGATTNLLLPSGTLTIPASTSALNTAIAIKNAINGNSATSGYSANNNDLITGLPTSSTVYIIKTVTAPSTNAKITAVAVSSTPTNYGTLTPPVVGIYPVTVTGLTVNGVNVWTGGNLVLPALQSAVLNAAAIAARITVAPYSATNVDPATALPSGTVFITSTTNVAIATLVPALTFTSYGTLTAPAGGSGATPLVITAVTINGANHLTAPLYIAPGVSQTTIAQLLGVNIGTGFAATNVAPPAGPAGGTDYITSSPPGTAIAAALSATATNAFATLTALANPSATLPAYVNSISVNGSNILPVFPGGAITIAPGAGAIAAANAIVLAINANSGVSGVTASNLGGTSATVTLIKCTGAVTCAANPTIISMAAVSNPTFFGTLTVPATANYPATVSAVNITATGPGTRNALTGSVVIPANTAAATAATNIAAQITANGYVATASGATITIYSPTVANNFPITAVAPVVSFVNYATLTAPAGGSGTTPLIIKAITVNGTNVLTVASLNLAPGLTQAQVATAIAANIGNGFIATANVPTPGTVYIQSVAGPGATVIATLTTNAYNNSGTITPPATTNLPGQVTAININGVNVMTGASPLVIPPNTLAPAAAALIRARIPAPWVTSLVGNVITVQGGAAAYTEITALSVTTAPTNYATLTFPIPVDPNYPVNVTNVVVNGTAVLTAPPVVLPVSTPGSTAATSVNAAINQALGFTSSVAGNVITIFANNNAVITTLTAPFTTTYYGTFVAPAANGTPLVVSAVTLNGANVLGGAPKFFQPAATAAQVAIALAATIPGATVSGATVTVPNGNVPVATLTVTAKNTYGTVTGATPPNGLPGYVTSITVNGTNVLASTLTIAANATPSAAATTIAPAVGSGYSASASGATVTIIKCTVSGVTCTTDPTITTVAAVAAGTNYGTLAASATTLYPATINNVMVNGVNALTAGPLVIAANQTAAQAATSIANAIAAGTSAFTATANSPTSGTVYVTSKPVTTNAVIATLTSSVTQTYYGTLAAPAAGTTPLVITAVNVNGANVLSPTPLNIAPGQTAAQVATAIAARIGGGFSATANVPVSGTVYITSTTTPITTLTYAAANSFGTLNALATPNSLPAYVASVTVNGTNTLIPAVLTLPAVNTAAQNATLIAANIGNGYTATASGSIVTIISNANAAISTVISASTPTNYASLTPPAVGAGNPVTLTAITANGVNLLLPSGNLLLTAPKSAANAAIAISAAINANTGTSGFTSTIVGSSVYIYNPTTNAAVTTLTSIATNYGTLVAPAANGTVPLLVSQVLVNGTNVLATAGLSFPPSASANTVATTIAANINTGLGYTATASGSTLTFTSFPVATNAVISSLSVTANNAAGTLTAAATGSLPAFVNSVSVNGGANILTAPLPLTLIASQTASQNATAIALKINANSGVSGYSATASGAIVTIISNIAALTNTNVAAITGVTSVVTPTYFGTLTPPVVGSSAVQITAVTVNGTNRLTGGTLTLAAGTTPAAAATAIAAQIGSGGYSATANSPASGTVYIFASPNAPIATLTTTATTISYGTITAPAASATVPLVISAVTVNGTNALTTTLNIAPGTSATSVASQIVANIGNGFTATNVGATITVTSNINAAITTLTVTAVNSSGTLTAVAPGAVPSYISQVNVTTPSGTTNALTTPLAFAPGTSATAVATAISGAIGNGFSATSSGTTVTIIDSGNEKITAVTSNAANAFSASLNVGNWTGAPSAGNGTISGITVGGIAVAGTFSSTTPTGLASAVTAGINAGGASFSPGGAPSATQYSAIASGNVVTVYSPLTGAAPAAIGYTANLPPNTGPAAHGSVVFKLPIAEGVLAPPVTITSMTLGGSAACPAYPSSPTANLLNANVGPSSLRSTLYSLFSGKDQSGDAYTMTLTTDASFRYVTFTENASGTNFASLNGCTLNVTTNNPLTYTVTPFSGGVASNTTTAPSGGSFGGGGTVNFTPTAVNTTVTPTTSTTAATTYNMSPAAGLGSYTLTGATNNTSANVSGSTNLGAYAMAPATSLGGTYNLTPLPNNPAATLTPTPNLGAYSVTATPNLNGAYALAPLPFNPAVVVTTTPNLGGYTITPNLLVFTYIVPTAINNVVVNLSPVTNLGGFTTSTTNNSGATYNLSPGFSNPAAGFVGVGNLGAYVIATGPNLTGGAFALAGLPFNPVVAMTATPNLGAYNAVPVTGLGGPYSPVALANNPPVNLSPTANLGAYTFPASTSPATGTIGTTSVPFTGSTLSNLPSRSSVGVFQRVDIVPATPTYTVPSTRTDCVGGTTCTYSEELTNFSNWYSYYRTRMQLMKTGAGLSFSGLGAGYRVGFITIHPATAPYVPISEFNAAQKSSWYTNFYATDPNSPDPDNGGAPRQTPLRSAMSVAGRIFAGQHPPPATDDPMQFSCQQNFLLMTTDGYWLEGDETAVKQLDGSRVDNQDSAAATPYKDGDATSGATSCPLGAGNAACLASACQGAVNNQTSFSSCNTLADVAYYYYTTDLRTTGLGNCTGGLSGGSTFDTCADNVPTTASDTNVKQHMTTFTLGLGVDGFLNFTQDYATNSTGDFAGIRAGTVAWPQVKYNDVTGVDDLWHAAVNGRGTYFSARDPTTLRSGINSALSSLSSRIGAGAAAATSNLQPVAGDNYAFVGSYTTQLWTGNLEARAIDTQAGTVGQQALWCVNDVVATAGVTTACSGGLKTQVSGASDTRNIFFFKSGAANNLASFTWANLTSAGLQGNFDPTVLSQYGALSAAAKTQAGNSGNATNLINWLRGETDHEELASNLPNNKVFRARSGVLGDVIGSQPVYVKRPYFSYADPGYSNFKVLETGRAATVYIGVNDGMLHAIDASTTGTGGTERWAYVPSQIMSNMTILADDSYAALHKYFVDATPTISDICTANCNLSTATWKTILIGGFNSGGRGYYALDVTNPATPIALWEFTPASATTPNQAVGYSFGNPIITKDASGTWVVLMTSGYNNVSPGDGQGHLYVLNAFDGTLLKTIDLDASVGAPNGSVGSVANPSGFAKIAGFNTSPNQNNQVSFVYGGDLLGNLWRIDFNAASSPVVKIAELTDASGVAQPVTTKPELALVGALRIVLVGTGKFLEQTDKVSTQTQTVYGIYDKYDSLASVSDPTATLADPHHTTVANRMVGQTLACTTDLTASDGTPARSLTAAGVNSFSDRGWFVDLCGSTTTFAGERVNVDPLLTQGVLKVASNIPQTGTCTTGGQSFIDYFDFRTGGNTTNSVTGIGSLFSGNALIVGMVVQVLASGVEVLNVTKSDNPTPTTLPGNPATPGGGGVVQGRRSSWRELVQ